ncbi:glutathione peroxidase [Marinobacter caseinilyticus]|uniref:glutathione peroxidase n=1 Tax=Marinobacter caseinilyticus TaxID=2692195 RepID=UPI00140DFAD4|nr:glutathione peroxidase [Marinobacter caseinilyticus]
MYANPVIRTVIMLVAGLLVSMVVKAECPAWLDHYLYQLRSTMTFNLCEPPSDMPLLVVNTASFCGYAGQFRGLEALYQSYRQQGLRVVGVPSNDFRQEASTEEKTAEVCFVDYGVTFPMTSPQRVRGNQAHPLFRALAEHSGHEPQWNFNKYLVDPVSGQVWYYPSQVRPDDEVLINRIESLL